MNRILITLLITGLISVMGRAQTTNAFRVNYNQALFDLPGNAVEALTPTNYVFAGTNLNFLPIYGTVTQIDDIGALVWSKRYYDGSFGFQLNDIKKDASLNEYYLCGGSESNAGVFMRIDAAGNVVASTKFEISEADGAYFNRVIKTSDGGYVAVGYVIGHDPDGAGAEEYFGTLTCNDTDGDFHSENFGSPLIVKMDANGNHLWHQVFRYYNNAAKLPAQRIYNDASFVDVVEVNDGYMAVGSYDVTDWDPDPSNDCDDQSPTDAIIVKTTTAGAITYHRQFDNLDFSSGQVSKYFGAINKTSAGDAIAAGGIEGGREWITKYPSSGGWALTFSRKFTYSSSFFGPNPVDVSQIYEVAGGTDIVTMGMYIIPFSFVFSNSLHRMNSAATTNTWAKYYTFGLATILPRGSQVSDNGYIMTSTTMGAANFDYHVIKTDPTGDTPLAGCAPVSFTPTAAAGPTTTAVPNYNAYSGTVGPQGLTLLVANVTPTQSIQCSFTACTPPTINTQPSDITMCSTDSDNLTVAATGGPYQWQYNNGGSWENVTNGSPAGFTYTNGDTDNMTVATSGAAQGTYQFQVIAGGPGCEVTSNAVNVTVPGATQLAPTGTQCSDVLLNFSAFPTTGATYAWTVTPPGGTSATPLNGSGQTFSYTPTNTTGSAQNFTVSVDITYGGTTCSQNFTNIVNPVSTAPMVGTITQPDCVTPTGSVALSGLPASGSWTVTANPGGSTLSGSGTTGTFTGLTANTVYTFTVTNSFGCTSSSSTSATINPLPSPPSAPVVGTITQPTCATPTGDVALSGLPASGTWTITANPGGFTQVGSGTTATFTGLNPGTYTFTVTNDIGCTSSASASATVDPVPGAPSAPIIGTITQPTCFVSTASVDLSGLPASGSWTITESPGGTTLVGSGTTATFSGLANNTTYTFTVTNDLGCTSSASLNAIINPQPVTPTTPVVGTITQPTCAVATGSVDLSGLPATGSWTVTEAPGGTTISGSGTTATFSGLTANTTYTFTVTNADGCTSTSSVNAVIDPQPATPTTPVVGTITQPTCAVATGSVDLSGLPASGSWTVTEAPGGTTISGSGTTATFSGLADNTTYTFTVTNADGCTSTASVNAVIDPQPVTPTTPVVGTITQPTCAVATGSVDLSGLPASGSWTVTEAPGGTTISGSGTTATFSGLAANTTYTFTVINSDGCTSTASVNAVIDPQPVTPTTPVVGTITQPTCAVATGSVDLSGLPATGSWTITEAPGGTTIVGSGTTATFSGLTANTTYTFTVTNADGCTSTASVNAIIDPQPVTPTTPVVGTITQPTCAVATGSVDLSGLPASGSWTVTEAPGGTTISGSGTTATFSGLTANTTYTFTVTNADGCTSTASVNAIIDPQPVTPTTPVVGTITQPTCAVATGSVDLSGLPASGSWTVTEAPGGTTISGSGTTATFSGLTANTTYTFTVTNADGCTSTISVSAVIDPQPVTPTTPVVGTITQPTCAVATGSVDLSGLPASGSWTVTESLGGTTISGSGTTATFSGLNPGTYTFTVTNDVGCTSVASVTATIDPAPGGPTSPVIGTITQPTCAVATGSVDLSGLPASGNWTVTESLGGTTITGSGTTATFSGLNPGTYTFTVTNDLGCTSAVSINAVINPQPVTPTTPVVGTITQPTCAVATGSVDLSGLPASGSWTVTEAPGGTTISGSGTTATFSGLTANTTYTFTVTNADGCTSTVSVSAMIDPQPVTPTTPVVGTITQPTCAAPSGEVDLSGLPNTGTWTITANPGAITQTGTGTTATFSGLNPGSYTFTVTNDAGCTSVASTSTTIDPVPGAPTITLDSLSNISCNGGNNGAIYTTASGATAPYTYVWTPNVGASDDITGLAAGSYSVVVTDALGCSATDSWTIIEPAILAANGVTTDVDCSGGNGGSITTAVSGGTANYTYLWSPDNQTTDNISNLAAGNYNVTITDANGCTTTENFTINTSGSIAIDVTPEISTIEAGSSVDLTATGATNYSWTPIDGLSCTDCSNPTASPDITTTYYVVGTDDLGCTGMDTALVIIEQNCGELYVPNIFSPNGDLSNDYLCVYGNCVAELSFKVYDRWGELVFSTEETITMNPGKYNEVCWDGMFREKLLNSGVFAYSLYAKLTNGDIVEQSGNITLVR